MLKSLVLFSFLALTIAGCSTADKDENTASGLFNAGEKFEADERYEEALQKFADVKNKHPYSRFATDAELHIADVHYKREAFIEAKSSYQTFKELHPKHAKIDYVTFRLAMSLYNQLPSTIDRDLSSGEEALPFFDEIINNFKTSVHFAESQQRKNEILSKLAEKQLYIADFYMKKEKFSSALKRYEGVTQNYPNLGHDTRALFGAFNSAIALGEIDTSKKYYHQLIQNYPQSDEAQKARDKASKNGIE